MITLLQEDVPQQPQQKKGVFSGKQGLINALALGTAGYLGYQNRDAIANGINGLTSKFGSNSNNGGTATVQPANGAAPAKGAAPTNGASANSGQPATAANAAPAQQNPAPGGGSVPSTPPASGTKVDTRYNSTADATKDPVGDARRDAEALQKQVDELNKVKADASKQPAGGGTVPAPNGKSMGDDWHSQHKAGSNVVRDRATGAVEERPAPGGGNVPNPAQQSATDARNLAALERGKNVPAQQPQEQIASKAENGQNLNPAQVAAADARNLAASEREMNAAPGGGNVPSTTATKGSNDPIADILTQGATPPVANGGNNPASSGSKDPIADILTQGATPPGGGHVPNPAQSTPINTSIPNVPEPGANLWNKGDFATTQHPSPFHPAQAQEPEYKIPSPNDPGHGDYGVIRHTDPSDAFRSIHDASVDPSLTGAGIAV